MDRVEDWNVWNGARRRYRLPPPHQNFFLGCATTKRTSLSQCLIIETGPAKPLATTLRMSWKNKRESTRQHAPADSQAVGDFLPC
jgi:hypothetical protein